MIKDKVKALFTLTKTSQKEIAEKKGISFQHLNVNINQRTIKAKDLVEYAHFTGTTLAFLDSNNNPIVKFDINDLEE